MITYRHQNVVQNQNMIIGNLSFENVEELKYVGVTVTNTNDICKEIKHRINMENACYYSLDKILSSCLLSKKLKANTYNNNNNNNDDDDDNNNNNINNNNNN